MYSNFVTAPDYIESILVIGATEDEIRACAEKVQVIGIPYNVYFYNPEIPDIEWLNRVAFKVDTVLLQEEQLSFKVPNPQGFGPNCILKSPVDYFAK
jgi:hypothetical protein